MKGYKNDQSFRWFVNGMIIMGLIWIIFTWFYGEEDSIYFDEPPVKTCPNQEEECAYG
jgi:hypothetical protein|tara:strand:+ start:786 stop:959 length:174 start_codon:yes stop_codon:yes gene_type:complete